MRETEARKRVRRVLAKHRIVLLSIGANALSDCTIPEYIERNGATVINPEYAAIIREIVRVMRPAK